MVAERLFVLIALAWTIVALITQVFAAWGGGRRDFSVASGDPTRGMLYSFTYAMLPSHKETVWRHPVKFAIGVLMHVGALVALLDVILLAVQPAWGAPALLWSVPALAIGLPAGIYLFIRRCTSPLMRAMSCPDDYLAMLVTVLLTAMVLLAAILPTLHSILLIFTGLLLVYFPLGKLRHAVFFFVARGDYGRRLGYRGVYPPSA